MIVTKEIAFHSATVQQQGIKLPVIRPQTEFQVSRSQWKC